MSQESVHDGTNDEVRIGRAWVLDDDGEFVWDPLWEGHSPEASDVTLMFDGLDRRIDTIVFSAKTPELAASLLFAIARASGVSLVNENEVHAAKMELVAFALSQQFENPIAGYPASVVIEGEGFALHLDGSNKDQNSHIWADANTLEVGICKALGGGEPSDDLFDVLVKAPGTELSTMQRKRATVIGFGLAATAGASAFSFGAAAVVGVAAVGTAAVSARATKRNSENSDRWQQAQTSKAVNELLQVCWPRNVALVDGMTPEEWGDSVGKLGFSAASDAMVVVTEAGGNAMVLHLGGVAGARKNPLLVSIATAAIATIVDAIMGGRTIHGARMSSVEIRGCRGCAVTFKCEHRCIIS
eukprot:TRINITY_DN74719_c0_g1_i1.p1 TRINITY_DN74719_c0_g1~~TRINITY_DN74719_c0_g1_i1.p1  ORF type:complete len:357 (-),score=50.94 TRINITY_DN74719_c0_g1_i1:300-1370(-)